MRYCLIILLFTLGFPAGALAKDAAPAADDPVLERRVMDLAAKLRCLQCQNQSIAESDAPLAIDLRNQMREQMRQGKSERDVIDFLLARYGDFVLLRPPLKPITLLLWIGPLLLFIAGLIVLFYQAMRPRTAPEAKLSETEHARALRLLGAGSGRKP
jgi:cytochrome c-type biogenesis protein CcmH